MHFKETFTNSSLDVHIKLLILLFKIAATAKQTKLLTNSLTNNSPAEAGNSFREVSCVLMVSHSILCDFNSLRGRPAVGRFTCSIVLPFLDDGSKRTPGDV